MSTAMRSRVIGAFSLLRAGPFDLTTADGRSKERYRRIILSGASSALAKAVGVVVLLISVPLTLSYLGQERYGMLVILTSMAGLLAFADFGLGNGLINALADASGRDDIQLSRRYVSTAFFMLSGLSVILLCLFVLALKVIHWPVLFNVTSDTASREAGLSVTVFALCFVISLPLGVVQKIQAGFQESYVASLWQATATVLSLVLVVAMIRLHAGLPWIVLSVVGAVPLAALLNTVWVFLVQRPSLAPRVSEANLATGKALLRAGSFFLILQLSVAVAYQTDSIIVAQILGAERVSEYAVPMTLFQLSPLLLGVVLTPLWPAYAESLASGDVAWVRKSFRRSLMLALSVNIPAAVLLMVYGASIMQLWVGETARPSGLMLVSLGMWTMVNSMNGPFAMLLNGIGALRFQAACALSMAGANLVLSIWLTHVVGAAGVVLGTVISQVLFIVIPSAIFIPRAFAGMQRARRQL